MADAAAPLAPAPSFQVPGAQVDGSRLITATQAPEAVIHETCIKETFLDATK